VRQTYSSVGRAVRVEKTTQAIRAVVGQAARVPKQLHAGRSANIQRGERVRLTVFAMLQSDHAIKHYRLNQRWFDQGNLQNMSLTGAGNHETVSWSCMNRQDS
jgi:hypothetical protein